MGERGGGMPWQVTRFDTEVEAIRWRDHRVSWGFEVGLPFWEAPYWLVSWRIR